MNYINVDDNMEFINNVLQEFVSLTFSDILDMTTRNGSGKIGWLERVESGWIGLGRVNRVDQVGRVGWIGRACRWAWSD